MADVDTIPDGDEMKFRELSYIVREYRCKTPCPYDMKATCMICKINKPVVVHIGSWMEEDCPYLIRVDGHKKTVICSFDPELHTSDVYNCR